MSKFAIFDVKEWPVVKIEYNNIPKDLTEFEDYLKGFNLLYQQNRKFNLLIDATNIGKVPVFYGVRQAFFMSENKEYTKKYVNKVAIILMSDGLMNMLKSVLNLNNQDCDIQTFKDINNAKQWLKLP